VIGILCYVLVTFIREFGKRGWGAALMDPFHSQRGNVPLKAVAIGQYKSDGRGRRGTSGLSAYDSRWIGVQKRKTSISPERLSIFQVRAPRQIIIPTP